MININIKKKQITIILLSISMLLIFSFTVLMLLKSSDVFIMAFELSKANKTIIEKIGQPIETGFFVGGSINLAGPKSKAFIYLPIYGPMGRGVIHGDAEKKDDIWKFHSLIVTLENNEEINLISDTK